MCHQILNVFINHSVVFVNGVGEGRRGGGGGGGGRLDEEEERKREQ